MINYDKAKGVLNTFNYQDITLSDGMMQTAYEKCYKYYMDISVDDMLYELRAFCNIENPKHATSLHNEEGSWFGVGSNVLGQWLQAHARFYAVTRREEIKEKVSLLIQGFKEIMKINPQLHNGIWYYFFEKYLWGFVECFVYFGNRDALELARLFFDTAINSKIYKKYKRILGDNGTMPEPTEIEWYVSGEAMLRYADVEELEGNEARAKHVREYAKQVEYRQFWDIFYNNESLFEYSPITGQNTAYFHGYSHLNSFNTAAYFYKQTGDEYYLTAMKNFYKFMREKEELITGGYGPHLEWLLPKTGIINAIENFHDSFETQCCSYAVYRLSSWLMQFTGEAKYGNWSEKLLYNATLASIDMDKAGHVQYYSDLNVESSEKYLHKNTWTCCTGTRPLLINELLKCIYYHNDNDLYVNLFIPSKISFKEMNVELITKYPYEDEIYLKLEKASKDGKPFEGKIFFRNPESAKSFSVFVNGKKCDYGEGDGWIYINSQLFNEDVICVSFERKPVWSNIEVLNEGIAGISYGPLTLATSSNGVENILDFTKDVDLQLDQREYVRFKVKNSDVCFTPYMDYKKGEKYHVYFRYRRVKK